MSKEYIDQFEFEEILKDKDNIFQLLYLLMLLLSLARDISFDRAFCSIYDSYLYWNPSFIR